MTPQCEHGHDRTTGESVATNKESLIVRLRAACNGLPGAVIAWPHRILHEAAEELAAANARIAELEARLATAEGEVVRLNQWADGMTDIALKERATGEAYQRELRDKIADLEAKVEKAPCSDFCFCGHAEGHGHHGPPTVSFNHDFQPGPCTCGHDRVVGHD